MYSLGIDLGSSSVKVSLLDISTGQKAASASYPKSEAPISSSHKGWAEQNPHDWWDYICNACAEIKAQGFDFKQVKCIGVSYQMHGLVCLGQQGEVLRDAIIWCDSRAVEIGAEAFKEIGEQKCLESTLNSPGNFTASKLAWVKKNEPEIYARTAKFMLPGDYIAYRLSGEMTTTASGLSEGILWDFKKQQPAEQILDHYGIDKQLLADLVPSIGIQSQTSKEIQQLLDIPEGTPISYRAGDQPNNAFSLNVLEPGEVAATAGTSGVVYGVTDVPKADPQSRVNSFLHVSPSEQQRLGVLLCINSVGIMNSWLRKQVCPDLSYPQMNELAASAPVGSDGLLVLPFGNGAERMLCGDSPGAKVVGLDCVRHSRAHLVRAVQEGIAFSFRYGIDIMRAMGLNMSVMRAGYANMFLSPIFRKTLASLCDAHIELLDTDGSLGAARAAALGAGFYASSGEAFASLQSLETVTPDSSWTEPLEQAYKAWKAELEK